MAQRKTRSKKTSTAKGTTAAKKTAPRRTATKGKSASTSRAKATKAPKKMKDLNYIDGKHDVEKIKQLEELVGIKETNLYGTTSLEVLEARVIEMNMWELQEFAVKVGVFPSGTRTALKNKIFKEFEAYNKGKGRHIVMPSPASVGSHLSKEELKKVLELTKRGL